MSTSVAYVLTLVPLAIVIAIIIFLFVRFSNKMRKSIQVKLKSADSIEITNSQIIKRFLYFLAVILLYGFFCVFTHEISIMLIIAAILSGLPSLLHQTVSTFNNLKSSVQNNNQDNFAPIIEFNSLELNVQDGVTEDSLVIDFSLYDKNNELKTNQYFYVEEISVRFCHDIIAFQRENKNYLESIYDNEANFTILKPSEYSTSSDNRCLNFSLETNRNKVSAFDNAFGSFFDSKMIILDVFYSIEKKEEVTWSYVNDLIFKNDLNSKKTRLYFRREKQNSKLYIYEIVK